MNKNSPASRVIRIRYSKTGRAGYISHLDLVTVMQRAFIRAGIKLKYSEGFNPHPYISAALPLSVGAESMCELMDVAVNSGNIGNNINSFLPEGLQIHSSYKAWRSFSEIKWVETEYRLFYKEAPAQDITVFLTDCLSAGKIIISKKSKKRVSAFDAAPHISNVKISRSGNNNIQINANVSAQNPTISHKDILNILENANNIPMPDVFNTKRIEIYDKDMVLFK